MCQSVPEIVQLRGIKISTECSQITSLHSSTEEKQFWRVSANKTNNFIGPSGNKSQPTHNQLSSKINQKYLESHLKELGPNKESN